MNKHVSNHSNFTAKFQQTRIMAEKKIVKKAYAILQDALFEKDGTGAYKPREMAKEGMTTLKKHSTNLVVVCTDSSIEDVTDLLNKNNIPFDKVIKLDEEFDFIVTGDDNCIKAWSWESALSDIGWKLSHNPEPKKDTQERADNSLESFFKKEEAKCVCRG